MRVDIGKDIGIGKIGINLFLHKMISWILLKENNGLKKIFFNMANSSKPTGLTTQSLCS